MPEQGVSFDQLINSLSGYGSSSGDLAEVTSTGSTLKVRPLTNYDSFANHVFFGDAIKRYRNSLSKIENTYPIGLSAGDISSLCAENIFKVDQWKKEAKGFDLWLLKELSQSRTVTASATNNKGELVFLTNIRRTAQNGITGSQSAVVNSVSAEAHLFEEENIAVVNRTAGTATDSSGNVTLYGLTAEERITRGPNLKNMLPQILFAGDSEGLLEKLLGSMGDMLDELKEYVDQIQYIKNISYDDYNRVPNRFLPVLAQHHGVQLFQSAVNTAMEGFFVDSSTTGLTTQEVSFNLWNRIMNNLAYLLKTKGTREVFESINRIYGVDHNFVKTDEYSIFNKSIQIRDIEEVDTPVLFSTGDVYVQMPTGSTSAFDFSASSNFTLEARVSATAAITNSADQKIIVHPLYEMILNPSGQLVFTDLNGTSAFTTQSSISSFIGKEDNFVNLVAQRNDDNLNVFVACLTGTGSGWEDHVILASGTTSSVRDTNFDSSAGLNSFGTYFPGSGSFSGYIHEVRSWNVSLHEEDIKEHTRNFQSISFNNSTATNSATWASLSGHWKLKENYVLTSAYNYIVDSTTANATGTPVNFNNQSTKRYKIFDNMKKVVKWYPAGLAVDNDKITQINSEDGVSDQALLSFHLTPINALNRHIKNNIQNLNILEMLGDPEDLYRQSYTGPIVDEWKNILTGFSTTANDLVDINTFVKAMDNFNDVLGGMFKFADQFVPAKTNVLSKGLLVQNHLLERPKYNREDFGLKLESPSAFEFNTHHTAANSGVTAATTASFQGYKYFDGFAREVLFSTSGDSVVRSVQNKGDSVNFPKFSGSRVGRIVPVKVLPSDPSSTDVEITLNRVLISPTASQSAHNGFIEGKFRMLRRGRSFKSESPAIEIEFPASSDGTNYFTAEVGDIDNGRGRIVSGKDLKFVTKIDSDEFKMKLRLGDLVRGLSADALSLSGSIGIVPIRVTNLYSKDTRIVRVGISNDNTIENQLASQGGVKLST